MTAYDTNFRVNGSYRIEIGYDVDTDSDTVHVTGTTLGMEVTDGYSGEQMDVLCQDFYQRRQLVGTNLRHRRQDFKQIAGRQLHD